MTDILKAMTMLAQAAPITEEHRRSILHAIKNGGRVRMTIRQSAERAGVSRLTIWYWIAEQRLTRIADDSRTPRGAIRGHKAVYVWLDELDALLTLPHKTRVSFAHGVPHPDLLGVTSGTGGRLLKETP